jgi:hypothetical protein
LAAIKMDSEAIYSIKNPTPRALELDKKLYGE